MLAGGVVGANQQIADDGILGVAQCRDRHYRWESAAVLADVGELVDVFNPTRSLEYQRLKAWSNRRFKFDAQRFGARDHFLRIGNISRRDLVHDFWGRGSQHE